MAKTINFNPAVQVSGTSLTVTVDITEGGHTIHPQFAFDALDFDCNYSASNPYVAKFIFDPNDITQILDVQGDFTTVQFDGVTKTSAFALAELVVADIGQYNTGGGGSYTFPANHGNTTYVATGGNDGTGTVGNISKPFETLQAAIDALDAGSAGQVIILSSGAFGQSITGLAMGTTHPYTISIINHSDSIIQFTGTGDRAAGQLTIQTPATVQIGLTGGGSFNVDDYMNIYCRSFILPNTLDCDINHTGFIECDSITINANSNDPTLSFGYINWKNYCSIGEPITYTRCNPMKWKALVIQSGTAAPTVHQLMENTLGETPVFARSAAGQYSITSPGSKFTHATLMRFTAAENQGGSLVPAFSYTYSDETELLFEVVDAPNFALGDYLGTTNGTVVEIEVYP